MTQEKFSQYLRRKRRELGLSQEDLADDAAISANYLAKLETDKREPGLKVLSRLAVALNVPLDEILSVLVYTWPPSNQSGDHQYQKDFSNFPQEIQKSLIEIGRILDKKL